MPKMFLFLTVLAASIEVALAVEPRPNVLFIVCDDLNTHVTTSGYEHIQTPSFERLAASGMRFDRAYCQYPVCGPSRASFLSGLYPQSTGVLDNKVDIRDVRPGTISMPEAFQTAGYWAAAVGKVFHNEKIDPGTAVWNEVRRFEDDEMPLVTPIRQKFEAEHGSIETGKARALWRELYPTIAKQTRGQKPGYGPTGLRDEQHADGKNVRQIAAWMKQKAYGNQPFLMACGIHKPHGPYLAPDRYFQMYPLKSLQLEPASLEFWEQAPKIAQTKRNVEMGFQYGVENAQLRREYVQAYHACISFIDAQIGVLLDTLEQSGLDKNTIVVLTSDHGYMLGEKFMWGKVMLFEQCDRVPLIVRVPATSKTAPTPPGSTSSALVELVDLFPTLAELCRVKVPGNLQGRSLVPNLKDPQAPGKEFAYTVVVRGKELGQALRDDRWRYTLWPDGQEELYDLKADPQETRNLARSHDSASVLETMRTQLERIDAMARAHHP